MPESTNKQGQGKSGDRIALALSGGGSRAIAYHLGCLRALHDFDLLREVRVISTVSGGSVIGALYAYQNQPFEEFDGQVCDLLRRGLLWAIIGRILHPRHLLSSLATSLTSGLAAKIAQGAYVLGKMVIGATNRLAPMGHGRVIEADRLKYLRPPFRRRWSRSHAFEEVLANRLFGDKEMGAPRRNDLDIVINATDLRTATAFRYGSRATSAWRYGHVEKNACSVAEAVASSAAYPLFLPAFHRSYPFVQNGDVKTKEVVLTDGGVYDNLGTTCLRPGRDPQYTDHVYNHNTVIACHAGMGQWPKKSRPYGWMSRVSNSMLTTFRKNEDAQKAQVLSWGAGKDSSLRRAILTSLGQKDENLRRDLKDKVPDDLTPRVTVAHYPTDFNPMPQEDLNRIVLRGKQITRLLIEAYWR